MTTTKTEGKKADIGTKHDAPTEELQLAYEIHTLAQMIYGEMAMANPWVHPAPPLAGFEPSTPWMAPEAPGSAMPWSAPTPWSW